MKTETNRTPNRSLSNTGLTNRCLTLTDSTLIIFFLLIHDRRLLDSKCIVTIPWIFRIDTESHPLRDNSLGSFKHRTPRMFRVSRIHDQRFRINVRKENTRSRCWFDMNARIAKVGMAAIRGNVAIHDQGGHARSRLVRLPGAITCWKEARNEKMNERIATKR